MRKSSLVIPAAVLTLLLSNPRQAYAQKSYFSSFATEDAEVGVEINDTDRTIRIESDETALETEKNGFAKKAFSKRKLEEIERAIGTINLNIYSLAEKSVSEDKTASSTVKKITKVKVPWWAWEIQNAVKKTIAMQKIWPIKKSAEQYVRMMEEEEHHERFYMNSCYILAEAEAASELLDEIRKSAGTKFIISSGDINDIESVITQTWDIESAIEVGKRIKKRFENIEEYKKYDNELKIKRSGIKKLEDILKEYSIKTEKSKKVFEYDVDLYLQTSDGSDKESSSLKIIARKTDGDKDFNLNLYLQTCDFKKKHEYVTDYSFFNESDCRAFIFYPKKSETKVKVLGENVYAGYNGKWIEAVPEGKDKRVELIIDVSGRALDEAFRMGAKGYIIRTKNLIEFLNKEITNAENESIENKISMLKENYNIAEIPFYPVHAESTARRINLSVENAGDFAGLLVKAGIKKGSLQQQPRIGGIEELVIIYKKNNPVIEEDVFADEDYFKTMLGGFRCAISIYFGCDVESRHNVSTDVDRSYWDHYPKSIEDLSHTYLNDEDMKILRKWVSNGVLNYDNKHGKIYSPKHPEW